MRRVGGGDRLVLGESVMGVRKVEDGDASQQATRTDRPDRRAQVPTPGWEFAPGEQGLVSIVPGRLTRLQRLVGNQAVAQLLASPKKRPRDPNGQPLVVQRQEDDQYGSEWSAGP